MKLYYFNSDGWTTGKYTKRNGNTPENVHVIPDNIPTELAFFDDSAVMAKTQIERNVYNLAQIELAETARQAAKPDNLKQAENAFFALIVMLNEAENLGISHIDNPEAILQKGAALTITKQAYYGTLLQNAVHEIEINGGSWSDLPAQPHDLEV